jgi:hypothetical protein
MCRILSTLATHFTTFYRTFLRKNGAFGPKNRPQNRNHSHQNPTPSTTHDNCPQMPAIPAKSGCPPKTSLEPPSQHLRQVHRPRVRILCNLLAAAESVADDDRVFPSGAHRRKQHPLP